MQFLMSDLTNEFVHSWPFQDDRRDLDPTLYTIVNFWPVVPFGVESRAFYLLNHT